MRSCRSSKASTPDMANLLQLRRLEDLHGFLLVDKPEGIAFPTVVKAVKRQFNLVKVGHGGSLDAGASGLLVLLINDANRHVDRIMSADRSYEGVLKLGVRTSTGDRFGERLGDADEAATYDSFRERIDEAASQFRGDVFQTEPQFCAVRREGSAAYEIADTGAHKPFLAHVNKLAFSPSPLSPAHVSFTLKASKNLIVRALVTELGEALGCGASLTSLVRTRQGPFSVEAATPFQQLLETSLTDVPALVRPISESFAT